MAITNILVFSCLTLLIPLASDVQSARILGVFPMESTSHYIIGSSLFKELAARGHEMTVISPYPQKTPIKNYRDVRVEHYAAMDEKKDLLFEFGQAGAIPMILMCYGMGIELVEHALKSPEVEKLLKSDEKFDLVITEEFFVPAMAGIAAHFNAPNVLLAALRANYWSNHFFGNPEEVAYNPHLVTTFTSHMAFSERLQNYLLLKLDSIYRTLYFLPKQNEVLHKYLPHLPHLNEIIYNNSLILLNSDSSIDDALPIVPNMKEIGGFHVKPPKPLPKDLKVFLDSAKDGAIYFSLGSNLQSSLMPKKKIDAILKTFSKLKQKVIWKFEDETLPNKPPNLLIGKWLPQSDILAHPNIKVFISHGGHLGNIEAIYHGVPIVGIPIFGDQKTNIISAAAKGYAVYIPYEELNEEKLTKALSEVLNNPKYTENVKMRSRIMHDKQNKPMDVAVFWIEYVLRHGKAEHLRSAALDLAWYQRSSLDVEVFLIAVVVLVFCLIKKIIAKTVSPKKAVKEKRS